MIERIDLGVCGGYEYAGNGPAAVALPGAMLGGMPSVGFAIDGVRRNGWRVIQVWDDRRDPSEDATRWTEARLEAAASFAGEPSLVIAKSVTTRAADLVSDRGWPAVISSVPIGRVRGGSTFPTSFRTWRRRSWFWPR